MIFSSFNITPRGTYNYIDINSPTSGSGVTQLCQVTVDPRLSEHLFQLSEQEKVGKNHYSLQTWGEAL